MTVRGWPGMEATDGECSWDHLMKQTTVVAVLLTIALAVFANTAPGRQWLEDRIDSIRWFTNEVKTLTPR